MSDSTVTNTDTNTNVVELELQINVNDEIDNEVEKEEKVEKVIVNNYWFCNKIYLITGVIATSLIGYGVYRKMNN